MKPWIYLPLLSALAASGSTVLAAPPDDEAALRAVMVNFDAAIRNKDSAALKGLFHEGKVVWLAVGHPKSREVAARMSGAPVLPVEQRGAFELLDDPRLTDFKLSETLGEPTIQTDGQIAAISFDYDFRVNGQIQNWGRENWQLAKIDNAWKIVNLMYSYRLQAIEPKP